MAAAAAIILTAIWLYLIGLSSLRKLLLLIDKNSLKRINGGGMSWSEQLLTQPFLRCVEWLQRLDSLQLPLSSYHMKLIVLHGHHWTIELTKRNAAAALGGGYAAATGCAWLSLLGNEPMMLWIGLLLGIVLILRPFIEAGRKVERRKQQLITGLPDLLSKLMLLVGAGETVQHAFVRCLEGKEPAQHPLYQEWQAAILALRNGQSFSSAMERFNRNCAVQEVAIFTTVLLLNYRRGGDHFVLALRELSFTLWEKRKAIARSKGEEASSKLVFPLVIILLILMVLVAAPAVLLMA